MNHLRIWLLYRRATLALAYGCHRAKLELPWMMASGEIVEQYRDVFLRWQMLGGCLHRRAAACIAGRRSSVRGGDDDGQRRQPATGRLVGR